MHCTCRITIFKGVIIAETTTGNHPVNIMSIAHI